MRGLAFPALALVVLTLTFILTACGPAPTSTPSPTPTPDLQREALLAFTLEALAIEAERVDLLNLREQGYASMIVCISFRSGRLGEGFASAPELWVQMLLLDSPPPLQSVKDPLVEAYRLEIEAAQADKERGFFSSSILLPQCWPYIDRSNVDELQPSWVDLHGPWVVAQNLRRDAYTRWSQILMDHGIDPAKEGFTSLVQQGAGTMPTWPTGEFEASFPLAAWLRAFGLPAYGQNPYQQWLSGEAGPAYASWLGGQVLPYPARQAPTDFDPVASMSGEGKASYGLAALAVLRTAKGLGAPEQEQWVTDLGGMDALESLLRAALFGAGYVSPVAGSKASRLGKYRTQWAVETQGGKQGPTFLEYLLNKSGI